MKFALYGMPCAGKTTLLNAINTKLKVINGSSWLNEHTDNNFSNLTKDEQKKWRIKYTKYLSNISDEHIISDGHYSFDNNVVFTKEDGEIYDVFFYLYCEPKTIIERIKQSEKNRKFANYNEIAITKWQNKEMEQLRYQCHKRNKDFYVIKANEVTANSFIDFIDNIINCDFSSYKLAVNLVNKIRSWYPFPCELNIIDGDKTFINYDSFSVCSNNYKTKVFDGNFYTGHQSYLFEKEVKSINFDYAKLNNCKINKLIWEKVCDKKFIILSSGITDIWDKLSKQFNIKNIIANPYISADTKYYVGKLLHNLDYKIKAYGDSKNDLYLLKEADEGYLYIGKYMSKSLVDTDINGISILKNTEPYILEKEEKIEKLIEICKSSSGIHGAKLAEAHLELGKKLGNNIKNIFPNKNTAILVLERGGRFFGDGLYLSFEGKFYSYDEKKDPLPIIDSNFIIIVDSVINTGKSILKLIEKLKNRNPKVQICVVSNVIQKEALEKFKDYFLFVVRVSENKFIGKRQEKQIGNIGPDTGDRLFNLLDD